MVDTSAPASRLDTDPRRAHVSLSKHPYQIGVFGSGTIGPRVYELAYQVGAEIAKQGHILISGGMTGTMEASSRGASDADVNRPGMSGDSSSWKGWGHVRWFIEEV
ncbi:SLOG cluster 4 domain-containing protein, partial [Mycobacterium tuberculosis]|uniref:SLOG cluster 4 domain-containing protein n=1 Tax=Mycobacterium tuberculosis TaxID=1773 RepID=UPI0040535330